MQIQTYLLNVTGGIIEENNMLWANALVLESDDQLDVSEKGNIQKGLKPMKYAIKTDDDNKLVRELAKETYPAEFSLSVRSKNKSGIVTLEIVGFKSNIKTA